MPTSQVIDASSQLDVLYEQLKACYRTASGLDQRRLLSWLRAGGRDRGVCPHCSSPERKHDRQSCQMMQALKMKRSALNCAINVSKLLSTLSPTLESYQSKLLKAQRKLERLHASLEPLICLQRDFDFIRALTRGAYGQVFLVQHRRSKQQMAAKIFSVSEAVRLDALNVYLQERDCLLACNQARSRHFTRLFYSFRSEFFLFQMCEFVEGGDLSCLLEQRGRFSVEETRIVLAQLLLALRDLEELGIVHGDLKPENLMLDSATGCIKLIDFGLAFKARTSGPHASASRGTPEYMAPEQLALPNHLKGPESDVWSVGTIAYELITGHPLFYAETSADILRQISEFEGIDWRDEQRHCNRDWGAFSGPFCELLDWLLQPDPRRRPKPKEIMKHGLFAGVNWKKISPLRLPSTACEADVFIQRNRRYESIRFYNMAVLASEEVTDCEKEPDALVYTPSQRLALLQFMPLKMAINA